MSLPNIREENDVIAYIKRRFGDCRVGVELTDDQIRDGMFDALEELSRWIPKRSYSAVAVASMVESPPSQVLGAPGRENVYQQSTYVRVPEYFDESKLFRDVMDVVPSEDDVSQTFREGVIGFGFAQPLETRMGQNSIMNIPIWQYEMSMGWMETMKNTFAANFTWKFNEGYIYMWYLPRSAAKICYIWSATRTLEEVDIKYRKWFLDYTYAACQMILAEIRGKITSGIPGPAGNAITLNADVIRSEATQRMMELREELMTRSGSESLEWSS